MRACAALAFLLLGASSAAAGETHVMFAGDVLLSRLVAVELARTGASPWNDLAAVLQDAGWVAGNLEGAVGSSDDCASGNAPCFAVSAQDLATLKAAGFRALGTENNHAADLGGHGREQTKESLHALGLEALSFDRSPAFVRVGEVTLAVVTYSAIGGRDGGAVEAPSPELRQKLRLARGLSNLVVVFVHWGNELQDWPSDAQRRQAHWLVRNGADLIVGHHPHVVQEPECVLGRPVFFSLGNLLFDQKYSATQRGLLADCRISEGRLRCSGLRVERGPGTYAPRPAAETNSEPALAACTVPTHSRLAAAGFDLAGVRDDADGRLALAGEAEGRMRWRTWPTRLLSAEVGRLAGEDGPELLFTLERHSSRLDGEDAPRPYVYGIAPEGPVARWRGSALAWPLVDAALLPGGRFLCALHRGDSFIVPDPTTKKMRLMVYRWNGFGFSGVDDQTLSDRCRVLFDM